MRTAVSLIVSLLLTAAAFGQEVARSTQLLRKPNAENKAIAVFDLTTTETKNLNKTLFFPFPTAKVSYWINSLESLPNPTTASDVQTILDGLRAEIGATSDRWISKKGSKVDVYVLYRTKGEAPAIDIKEEDRDTRLSTDFATLVKIVKAVAAAPEVVETTDKVGYVKQSYLLTKTRATLKVTVTQKIGDSTTTLEKSIITGPTEHLFLSADVPITKVKELKYDDTSHGFVTKDAPTAFYAGFDYTLGDVLTTDQKAPWEGIVFKALLKVSKRPLDGYGVAIGYRSPNFGIFGMTLESFTPFVGYFRTKVDDKDASGNVIQREKNGIRFGVSFNLDKALEWTKKSS